MRLAVEMSMSAVAVELGESDRTLWRVFSYLRRQSNQGTDEIK